jgi:DNA-binding XRE family transcriptional regulator
MHRPAGRGSIPGLARQIREARHQAGLTQADLADELGVRQSSVGQWERGATTPTLGMFRRMVAVLGPWPLLEVLMPSDQPQSAAVPPGSRRSSGGPPQRMQSGAAPDHERGVKAIRKVVSNLKGQERRAPPG